MIHRPFSSKSSELEKALSGYIKLYPKKKKKKKQKRSSSEIEKTNHNPSFIID